MRATDSRIVMLLERVIPPLELLVGGIQIETEESKPNGFLMIWYLGMVATSKRFSK